MGLRVLTAGNFIMSFKEAVKPATARIGLLLVLWRTYQTVTTSKEKQLSSLVISGQPEGRNW